MFSADATSDGHQILNRKRAHISLTAKQLGCNYLEGLTDFIKVFLFQRDLIDVPFETLRKKKTSDDLKNPQIRRKIAARKQDEFFVNLSTMLEQLRSLQKYKTSINEITFLFGANQMNPKELWRFEIGEWNSQTLTKKEPLSLISKLPEKAESWARPRGKVMLIVRTTERIEDDSWCQIRNYSRDKKSSNILDISVETDTADQFATSKKPTNLQEEEHLFISEITARLFYA